MILSEKYFFGDCSSLQVLAVSVVESTILLMKMLMKHDVCALHMNLLRSRTDRFGTHHRRLKYLGGPG